MNRVMKRLALLVGFGGICVASGHPATPPADPVEATWKARSEVARTRLEKGGLVQVDVVEEKLVFTYPKPPAPPEAPKLPALVET